MSAASSMPHADGLAVQPLAVAGRGLDGVPERVAQVQQRPLAVLALVCCDDARP